MCASRSFPEKLNEPFGAVWMPSSRNGRTRVRPSRRYRAAKIARCAATGTVVLVESERWGSIHTRSVLPNPSMIWRGAARSTRTFCSALEADPLAFLWVERKPHPVDARSRVEATIIAIDRLIEHGAGLDSRPVLLCCAGTRVDNSAGGKSIRRA